ncbi:hypothetical protein B0A55_10875 [Friedmanniomyces simplex]|uniref:Pentatricopeptide repeat domain-containing protein n=1 Tax=Friedmanniomyces simplex TaxID=329884 RepID=A0A4U0WTP3_9PEZI|nr:hypothetical protein B0A55_10875 [Friedmanniomyces simplex]
MSETVRQAVLKKHVLMTAVAHMMFVALAYLEVFEKEELDEQDRTRIRQRERWLRMKARQSLRLRCEARERQWEREQGISDFDAAIAQAAARERDGTAGSARMREQPSEFRPAYFIQNQRKARQNKDKSRRRLEIQGERHKYSRPFRDDVWLNLVLRDLELSTPADPAEFRRTMETVRLPDGVRAVFKGNTGETILEIMQRTGSHLQILPFRHDGDVVNDSPSNQKATERRYAAGFQSLSLWGTPSENATAIDLLPGLVDAITLDPKASTNLRDYKHTTEETARFGSLVIPPIRRDEEVDNTDSMYWRQQDQESVSSDGSHDVAASSEIDDSSGPPIPIRALWFHETPSLESVFERTGADDTQDRLTFRRPAVWSTVMLTNHVETLVTIPPRLVNRRTKDKTYVAGTLRTNSYQQQIIAELLRCFSDPSASACVSRAAVDHALDYFVRHSNFLAVRQLLAILQDNSEYTLTTTNFDIFLAAAAANEDVHNFRLWLRNMLREELKPSPRTWASLHRLVCRRYPGTEMPGRVMSAMRAKGVLTDPETVREGLRDNVERRLTAYLASKTKSEDVDLDAFMSMYDKRYRLPLNQHRLSDARHSSAEQYRPWLTTVTTNIMAKVLLAHGRTQDALAVVRMYEDSGGPLRADTINTFLNAAERARDTGFAVSVLKYFAASAARSSRPAGKGIRLDAISYSTLFNVAWTRKNYNMLRVIWRYACCAGEVRWMVHQMVRTSLLKYVPATTSRRQLEREQGEVRLAEAVESVLKGSKAKKHTSENKEVNGLVLPPPPLKALPKTTPRSTTSPN